MLFNSIKIGNRIEISIKNSQHASKSFVSQVEEIRGDNELLIHMPISYGQIVKIAKKRPCTMLFFTEKGMVSFEAEVIDYIKDGSMYYMEVHIKSEGKRIQRREFFRYSCLLPLKFSLINENDDENDDIEEIIYDGIIKDLGGGGIRFVSNVDVDEDSRIKCIIMLGEDCLILIGNILHKQFFPKSNYKYQYRIQFTGVLSSEQEKIIQFIFIKQREELQRVRG